MDFYEKNKDACFVSAAVLAVVLAIWICVLMVASKESDNDGHIKQLQTDFETQIRNQSAGN